jgi:AcrR family transcriptional regulator
MRDRRAKERRILEVAERMFRERGVEGTILTGVAKASKAALGSVTHFFGSKPDLAAAVLDRVIGALAEEAKAALSPRGRSMEGNLRALQATCLEWPDRHGSLIAMLEPYASAEWEGRSTRLRDRLAPVLADWAGRRSAAEVAELSPSQLYAVVLAPALCPAAPAIAGESKDAQTNGDRWLDILAAATMTAITPPARPAKVARQGATRQGNLL